MGKRILFAAVLATGLVVLATCPPSTAAEKEKEEKEVKVAFADVPAAVKKTLADEGKGNKIDTVDKEEDDGKTTYEADVVIHGKNYEIKVAADGTLISKKLDDEESEKDGKKEKKGEGKDDKEKK